MLIMRFLGSLSVTLLCYIMTKFLSSETMKQHPFLKSHASFCNRRQTARIPSQIPFFSETLPEFFENGSIESVLPIKEITGPRSLVTEDGTQIDNLDAIIVCSGYNYDFSVIKGDKGNPTDPRDASDGDFTRYQTPVSVVPKPIRSPGSSWGCFPNSTPSLWQY